ncbi:hypothetical protein [Burkholderia cenocepacia]|uniref:hypothetical protein n=1 Tax=Burkholderia cenocepacia TaxID=95486 RepID=UPI0007618161|nr:hypothetical protein [Burkholderia cenocepacia]KWU19085.1 hypothetical protein AS149_12625 [Burkholderia cenocepacia]
MGGNALKNTQTQRLDRDDFERVAQVVTHELRLAFPGTRVDVIPAYREKATFGDLDLLVQSEGMQAHGGGERLRKMAVEVFNATDLFKNSNVLSFDYRSSSAQTEPGFQVDVIAMPSAEYEFALRYYSYNDLGNLIGRTAHKAGFSFGHAGLVYPFREGTYMFREVALTRDFDAALRFLGYDPEQHRQGFDNLVDIFEYVTGSKYFNPDIFLLENRSYKARVRDRKRKTYTEFLDYIGARRLPAFDYPEDKNTWLPGAFEAFPNFRDAYHEAVEDLRNQRFLKERFNGERAREITGLEGAKLGWVMKAVRESFETADALLTYFTHASEEEVRNKFLSVKSSLAL